MLKENWIIRVIITFLIVNMALGGWAIQNNVSLDTYIPIALVWYVIFYFCTGFFLRFKKPKDKPTLSKVYKSPVQSPTPTETFEPLKKITPNEIKEDIIETDYKTKIEDNTMNDEGYEITEQEKKNLLDQIKISAEEEEQIYVDVSKEAEPGRRREGIWTKVLIENGGDEQKTKITYMKLRVEAFVEELKNQKYNYLLNKLIAKQDVSIKIKRNFENFEAKMKQRGETEVKESVKKGVYLMDTVTILDFSSKNQTIKISIFKDDDIAYKFYWIKPNNLHTSFTTPPKYSRNISIESVRAEIRKYFNDLANKIE